MILVDTSIWIDHLHASDPTLVQLLNDDLAVTHSLVVQKLALGSLRNRDTFLRLLSDLRMLTPITHVEFLLFVEQHRLWGRGLSAVDVHLMGSVGITPGARLWTRDKRLRAAAQEMEIPTLSD